MKNLPLLLLCLLVAVTTSAQRTYFVYLESENASPFFVKMQDKLISSTASGYLILPEMKDSIHQLTVGFPASNTEYRFRITMGGKDHGFLLRQFDFGWGLFDMQSLSVIKPLPDLWQSGVSYQYRHNDFIALLAKASNDTTLFYVPIEMKDVASEQKTKELVENTPAPVTDSAVLVQAVAKEMTLPQEGAALNDKDSARTIDSAVVFTPVNDSLVQEAVLISQTTSGTEKAGQPVPADSSLFNPVLDSAAIVQTPGREPLQDSASIAALTQQDTTVMKVPAEIVQDTTAILNPEELVGRDMVYRKSEVKRFSESSTSEGFGLVFFDSSENGSDTIRLIIPNQKIMLTATDTAQFASGLLEIPRDSSTVTGIAKADTVQQLPPAEAEADTVAAVVPVVAVRKTLPEHCKTVAGSNDFFRLRKNMASRHTDEDMVYEARKVFRNKCFSTEQIRNLGALFLTSAGKYQFYDAAYGHVTDPDAFASLAGEIRDDYYLRRFKALIGE